MANKIIYAIILFFSRMPFVVLYIFSDFLAFLLNHVIGYRKEVIMNNLRKSFPEKTENELDEIRIQFNKNFSDQMIETLKMFTMSKAELSRRLVVEHPEEITKYIEQNRSVMLATGHYGNWEYPAAMPFIFPGFVGYNVVYAPINNEYLNAKIVETREKFGLKLVSKKNAFKDITEHDNFGQVYGFLFDQSPHKSRVKYDLHFLNQTTPVHLGTEDIAKMKNAIVLYLEVNRLKRGYYKAVSSVVTESPNETSKYEITNEIFRRLEDTIKQDPAQWLWSHKRWKYLPGRDYNL